MHSIVTLYCHLCRQYVFAEKQARNAHQRLLIGSVIVSVLDLSAVDRGFESRSGQTKDYKLVFVAYNANHAVLKRKRKTGWLGIRIICPSGARCISADCCFSDLAL